jgi:hypothetical protein
MLEPAPTGEIGYSNGIVQTEVAGAPTNRRGGPDTYCCPRSELTVTRHETARILGADAHTRERLWYIVHGYSKSSRIKFQPWRRTLVHIQEVYLQVQPAPKLPHAEPYMEWAEIYKWRFVCHRLGLVIG